MSVSLFRERLVSRLDAASGEGGKGISLPELSNEQFAQLEAYFTLLRHWNRRINLTALPLDELPDQTLDRLFVEPLCAARFLDGRLLALGAERVNGKTGVGRTFSGAPKPILRWADLGSGGGSPAIPLKIVCPSTHLTMVESRGRKAAFLREVARELKLPDVDVASVRAEALPTAAAFEMITVRAVRLDPTFLASIRSILTRNGQLILFLPHAAELTFEGLESVDALELMATSSRIALLTPGSK